MDFILENKASFLFLLGIVMMTVILLRRWHRYFKRLKSTQRKEGRPAAREAKPEQPLMDAPPEVLRWQVEMHETARELKAELDTKIAVLQRLTIDAKREREQLEAALARTERTGVS